MILTILITALIIYGAGFAGMLALGIYLMITNDHNNAWDAIYYALIWPLVLIYAIHSAINKA